MSAMPHSGHLRIGELARRSGVSPELLRAWERRYGLLQPSRSTGGFRLYTDDDELRVRRMNTYLADGLSAAEAAQRALREPNPPPPPSGGGLEASATTLVDALRAFDDAAAHELLDSALASFSIDAVIDGLIAPTLRALGDGWETGTVTIAQEHFASNIIRGRLLGISRGWGRGAGAVALLACASHEQHDLPLLLFGLLLRADGWRVSFLGADTPVATVEDVVVELEPRAVVLAMTVPDHVPAVEKDVATLAGRTRLFIGGAATDRALAERCGATLLVPDFRGAAEQLSPELRR